MATEDPKMQAPEHTGTLDNEYGVYVEQITYDEFIDNTTKSMPSIAGPSYIEQSSGMTKKEIATQRQIGYTERNPQYSHPVTPVKKTPQGPVTYIPITQSLHNLINPETGFRYGGR